MAPNHATRTATERSRGERLLVVDDDQSVREIIAEALQMHGYDVVQAGDGLKALAVLGDDPDIRMLVTDVRMDGMNGIDLAAHARQMNPKLRIILISGYFLPQQTDLRFLKKPFHVHDLVSAVAAELG